MTEDAGRGEDGLVPAGTEGDESDLPGEVGREAEQLALDPEIRALQGELEALNDRHLRLAAEFDNYRRRVQNEKADTWARAQADLVRHLLDSLDDLQRVALLEPDTVTVSALVEGVDLVERKLLRSLAEAGVEVVEPDGERFDPEIMEAVMKVPASSPDEDDRIHQVFQRGFRFKGHLVRPARVAVRKYE